jgi:hypothetical protein
MLLASEKVGFEHGGDLMALGEYGAGVDAADSGLEPGRRVEMTTGTRQIAAAY